MEGRKVRKKEKRYSAVKEKTKLLILTCKSFQENLQTFRTNKSIQQGYWTQDQHIQIKREKCSSQQNKPCEVSYNEV